MGCGVSNPVVPIDVLPPPGVNQPHINLPNGSLQTKGLSNGIPIKAPTNFRTTLRSNAVGPAQIPATSVSRHAASSPTTDEISEVGDVLSIKRVSHNRQLSDISEAHLEVECKSVAIQTNDYDLLAGVKYQYVQTEDLDLLSQDQLEEMLSTIDDNEELVQVFEEVLLVSPFKSLWDENQNQVKVTRFASEHHRDISTQTHRKQLVCRQTLTKLSISSTRFSRSISSPSSPKDHENIAKVSSVESTDFMTFSSEKGGPLSVNNDNDNDEVFSPKEEPCDFPILVDNHRPPSLTSSMREFSFLEQDIEKSSVKAMLSGSSSGRFINELNQVLGDLTEDSNTSVEFISKKNGQGKENSGETSIVKWLPVSWLLLCFFSVTSRRTTSDKRPTFLIDLSHEGYMSTNVVTKGIARYLGYSRVSR